MTQQATEKFTPGPWAVQLMHQILWLGTPKENGQLDELILHINQDESYKTEKKERNLANAKLIAAAPELYEAIKNYINAVEAGEVTDQLDAMKAAIKKATE